MSHHDIWQAVDRLAELHDLSPSALAKKAGLDATTFNKSKRVLNDGRLRWPSTESIMRILEATDTNWDEFVGLMVSNNTAFTHKIKLAPAFHIPMVRYAHANLADSFNAVGLPHGEHWDDVAFPDMTDKSAFVVEMSDNQFAPLYREGDRLVVSPHTTARKGDRIFIRLQSGAVLLQELTRQTMKSLELKAINGTETTTLATDEIAVMGRIIWVSQ